MNLRLEKNAGQENVKRLNSLSSILILGLMTVLVITLFWHVPIPRVDFYDELWAPAFLLVHGKSPYNTVSLKSHGIRWLVSHDHRILFSFGMAGPKTSPPKFG